MHDRLRYTVARALGVSRILRHRRRRHPLVLCYHGVVERVASPPRWTEIPVGTFAEHMAFLRRHYTVVPASRIVEWLRSGHPLPEHAAAVTFDDGYRNNFTTAFPVLRELGIPATIFLTTGFLDRGEPLWPDRLTLLLARTVRPSVEVDGRSLPLGSPSTRARARDVAAAHLKRLPAPQRERTLAAIEDALGPVGPLPPELQPLTWDDVRTMQASGLVEFGSHTVSHPILDRLDPDAQEREIRDSLARIEAETGAPCRLFAYPNGDFDASTQRVLEAASTLGAFAGVPRLVRPSDDPLVIPRILVGADAGVAKLDLLSSGVLATRARRPTQATRA